MCSVAHSLLQGVTSLEPETRLASSKSKANPGFFLKGDFFSLLSFWNLEIDRFLGWVLNAFIRERPYVAKFSSSHLEIVPLL